MLTMVKVEDGVCEATVLVPSDDVDVPEYDREQWMDHLEPAINLQRGRGGGLVFVAYEP